MGEPGGSLEVRLVQFAKSRTNENPVYYIQYAHARVVSVFGQLQEKGWSWSRAEAPSTLARLVEDHERGLMATLGRYPEVVETAAANRAPQNIVHYLRELAQDFHTWYNAHTFLVEDETLRSARLALAEAVRQVLDTRLGVVPLRAGSRARRRPGRPAPPRGSGAHGQRARGQARRPAGVGEGRGGGRRKA